MEVRIADWRLQIADLHSIHFSYVLCASRCEKLQI